MDFNRVILVGRLTRDVELRYLQAGTAVTDLGVAVNNRIKRGDEWVDEPCFVDVTVWGRTAENCNQYLSKGSGLMIEGRLKLDSWETPEGQKRSKLKVVADRVQFMPKGTQGGGGGGGRSEGGVSDYGSNYSGSRSGSGGDKSGGGDYDDQYHDENVPF